MLFPLTWYCNIKLLSSFLLIYFRIKSNKKKVYACHQAIIYKVLNNLTPEYLNVFQYVSQVSLRLTRQSVNNLLFAPKATTKYYRRSFVISSCNLWNNMSNEMRESTSLEFFKTKYVNEYFN